MGGQCSGSRKKVKLSPESKMQSPHYSGVEQYYSADIRHLLPNVQQSRPLYRFSNRDQPSRVDLNARIVDIRDVEDDLRMESILLKQNNNIPLGRCSTPDPSYCYHCDHKHRGRCCLYLGDKEDDINRYSAWTQDFEKTAVKPQNIKCIPEAVSYNSTPYWFPRYTPVKSNQTKASPTSKPFFQPFQSATTWQELLDPNRPTSLTPYQQYIVQLRQLSQEMQSPTSCQFDPTNPYCSQNDPRHHGIPYLQHFNNQHIYNGPVFMQQNNFSPYFNPFPYPYPYPYDTYQSQWQQAAINATPTATPIGYNPERQTCACHPHCTMKTTHPQLNSYFPAYSASNQQPPPGYTNPAAQVHSDGVSFPLWMLFSYNQTKSNDDCGSGRKSCSRRLYEPKLDHNCNIYHQPTTNGCEEPLQMEVDSNDKVTDDCPMQHPNDNPVDWNQS